MDLSIIIPSFNTKALVKRCLQSIFESLDKTRLRYEVIVVDNASTDGTVAMIARDFPRVRIIKNSSNVGYGKANNQAIHSARGTYILLLNSDVVVLGRAIEALLSFMNIKDRIFVGGKLLNTDSSAQSSCGPLFSLPVTFAMLFLKGDALGITRYSPTSVTIVDWVSGACLLGTRAAFEDVGFFDERIFMYMEEIDFLYRAKQKGYRVFFYPAAQFIHSGAASSVGRRTPVINIYRGLLYFYQKHRSRMAVQILQFMLRVKAHLAIYLGHLLKKKDLVQIYEEALRLV